MPKILDGCGVRIEWADPALLRDAIRDLLENPERRRGLGAAGRERFLERYNIRSWVPVVEDLLLTDRDCSV